MNHPIRILVVDDHTLFRRGLSALLARDPQLLVVGDAGDAGEAIRRAHDLKPDVVLLDNHLPGVTGVDAIGSLREAAPQARIIMLTVSEDEHDLAAALRAGASGYLLKTIEGDVLGDSLRRAMRGESVVAPEMTGKLVAAYRQAASAALPGEPAQPLAKQHIAMVGIREAATRRELDAYRCILRRRLAVQGLQQGRQCFAGLVILKPPHAQACGMRHQHP